MFQVKLSIRRGLNNDAITKTMLFRDERLFNWTISRIREMNADNPVPQGRSLIVILDAGSVNVNEDRTEVESFLRENFMGAW